MRRLDVDDWGRQVCILLLLLVMLMVMEITVESLVHVLHAMPNRLDQTMRHRLAVDNRATRSSSADRPRFQVSGHGSMGDG